MYRIVKSLYCTPETNITLYINYTGIFILFYLSLFILRERDTVGAERERERERENPKEALHCQHRA